MRTDGWAVVAVAVTPTHKVEPVAMKYTITIFILIMSYPFVHTSAFYTHNISSITEPPPFIPKDGKNLLGNVKTTYLHM